jgi:hypothetical protein
MSASDYSSYFHDLADYYNKFRIYRTSAEPQNIVKALVVVGKLRDSVAAKTGPKVGLRKQCSRAGRFAFVGVR